MKKVRQVLLTLFILLPAAVSTVRADVIWTNTSSGFWRVASNWTNSILPGSSSIVQITNAQTKTVTVDSSATNLTIKSLTIKAPTGATNTWSLVDLASKTFTSLFTITVGRNGAINLTNSTLYMDPLQGGVFNLLTGTVGVYSATLDCSQVIALHVGHTNNGAATLNVTNGMVLSDFLYIADVTSGLGTLNLAGGSVIASSLLTVGDAASSTGMVTMLSGQLLVTNGFAKVGNLGTGTMTISGGVARFDSEFHIADNPGSTGTVFVIGGQLSVTNDITDVGRYGIAQMTLSNCTVTLTNVSVGRHPGSHGTLNVQVGAAVSMVDDLSIGRFTNATGTVVMNGGQLLIPNDNLWVGREGNGTLIVSNGFIQAIDTRVAISNGASGTFTMAGGILLTTSNFVVGAPLVSTGQVIVSGGNIFCTNAATNVAWIGIKSGTMTINGGSVTTDNLILTNAGTILFKKGTLATKATLVANGAPFVVGDGTNLATLTLLGGTHYFPNGLTISSNAVVNGCGTIVGTVINNGTLVNCNPVITSINKTGSTAAISFTTQTGRTYNVQYKDSLNDANWTTIVPAVSGAGGTVVVNDTAATVPSRVYRVQFN